MKKSPHHLLVSEIMSKDLFTLFEDDTIRVLDEIMRWRAIRHIPVVNQKNELVGLVTHRDLLRLSFSALSEVDKGEQDTINEKILVGDVMQENVFSISPQIELKEAATLMLKNKFGCLPVVDQETRKLVGIITEADFVKFFVNFDVLAD